MFFMHKRPTLPLKSPNSSRRKLIIIMALVVIMVVIGIIIAGWFFYQKYYVIARVNDKVITRWMLYREMELMMGSSALDRLISLSLFSEEAKKRNISVSPAEFQTAMKKMEDTFTKQNLKLDTELAKRGDSRLALEKEIAFNLLLGKLFSDQAGVTDKEVEELIKQQKLVKQENEDEKDFKNYVKNQIKQQKIATASNDWLTQAKKKSKISINWKY